MSLRIIKVLITSVFFLGLTACSGGPSSGLQTLGGESDDGAVDIAVDKEGNSYMIGNTLGSIEEQSLGGTDAFVVKYSADGGEVWKKFIATPSNDVAKAVVVDNAGYVYIAGVRSGTVPAGSVTADDHLFLTKLDTEEGKPVFYKEFGDVSAKDIKAPDGMLEESVEDMAISPEGNIYLTGYTLTSLGEKPGNRGGYDAFLVRFNSAGKLMTTKLFGTDKNEYARGIAYFNGAVYISGDTEGSLGANTNGNKNVNEGVSDAFLLKYSDATSDTTWIRLLGTSAVEKSSAVTVDSDGNAYMAGELENGLPPEIQPYGRGDGFVAKYTPSGERTWVKLVGGNDIDIIKSITWEAPVVTEGRAEAYLHLCGGTKSALEDPGKVGFGEMNAFILTLKPSDGAEVAHWKQVDKEHAGAANGIIAQNGVIYVAGIVSGPLGDQTYKGGTDALYWRVLHSEYLPGAKKE